MTQDASLQEAIQVLRSRLGMRWEGERADGIDEMTRALQDGLNYNRSQARDAVEALITSGEITYNQVSSDVRNGVVDETATIPGSEVVAMPGTSSTPLPSMALNAQQTSGYWRLGRDTSDAADNTPIVGRAGQIDPTA